MSEPGAAPHAAGLLGTLERRAPLVAALVALVAALVTMTSDPIGVFNDDGIYLLTAKALAEGQGYVYPHLPGTPPAIHYPPVWPLLLAAAWKIAPAFPANIGWFKLINPIVLAAAAAGLVVFGQRLLGLRWWVALAAALAATVTVPVLLLTNLLLSEPLFLLLLMPTLWMTERVVREGGVRPAVWTAVLIALLVLVRTLGGVVLVAGVMLLAWERRWKELLIVAGGSVVLLLPWQFFVWRAIPSFPPELLGSYGPYLDWVVDGYKDGGLAFLDQVVGKNAEATWVMLGVFFSPLWDGVTRQVLAALALAAFGGGLVALAARGRAPVTALALSGYLVAVLAWPFWVDRFLWVVWPLVVLIMVAGVATLAARFRGHGQPREAMVLVAALLALAAGHTTYNARGLSKGWESSASRAMTGAGIRLVRHVNDDRSLDGQRIAAELAPMLAIYTGLEVLPVEILTPREHVVDKTPAEHRSELERIDRRFRPAAYVVMRDGPFYAALRAARLDDGRTLVDVSPDGVPVRTLKVQVP
ncbi:MAG: hypothetical protein KA761_05010 [Gemmatimonadaceae bacterium]|nr:hypothetical protein [Gemmatimonadaceae bacterium]